MSRSHTAPRARALTAISGLLFSGCAFLFTTDPVPRPDATADTLDDGLDAAGDLFDLPDVDEDTTLDVVTDDDLDVLADSPIDTGDDTLPDTTSDVDLDTVTDSPADTAIDADLDAVTDTAEDLAGDDLDAWLDPQDDEADLPDDPPRDDSPADTGPDDTDPPLQVPLSYFDLTTDTDADTVPDDAPLLITEIQANPVAVGDSQGEFAEVLNITGFDIDIFGLEVSDNYYTFDVASSTVLPAHGYLLFGLTPTAGASYGVPSGSPDFLYFEANFTLSNAGTDFVLLEYAGATIHKVTYESGSPASLTSIPDAPVAGRSFNLDQSFLTGAPATPVQWCVTPASPSFAYNTVSTVNDYGTPGHVNYDCP